MRTERQHEIDRALARTLLHLGGYLLPERALRDKIEMSIHPQPTPGEMEGAIRNADAEGRLTKVPGDTGFKYTLSDKGRAWADQQHL